MKRTNKMLSSQSLIQELEQRTMFSVVSAGVQDHNLFVNCGGGNDKLMVTLRPTATGANVLLVNGTSRTMKMFNDVKYVSINTGGGDDTVLLSGKGLSDSDVSVYVSVNLGRGNDRFVARNFDGQVSASGGDGNDILDATLAISDDAILGWSSGRFFDGGPGNDTLLGSAANDTLIGGDDDDLVNAGDGDDYLNGGSGANVLNGQGGDDMFFVYPVEGLVVDGNIYGTGGSDIINGGEGDDTIYLNYNSKSGVQTFNIVKSIDTEFTQSFDYGADYGGGKG